MALLSIFDRLTRSQTMGERLQKISLVAAGLVVSIAVVVLIGWQNNADSLERLLPTQVAMNPLTALCFVFSGTALILLYGAVNRQKQLVSALLAFITVAISIMILARYVGHLSITVDQWLFMSKLHHAGQIPNVMAPNTAFGFLLAGLSLLLITRKARLSRYIAQYAAIAVCFVALFALLGYVYESHVLTAVSVFIPMAANTAVCFLLLGVGILFVKPNEGLLMVVNSDQGAGYLMRRLLPIAVLVPALVGWFRILGLKASLYSEATSVTLSVTVNIVLAFIVVLISGMALYKKELEVEAMKDRFLSLATHQLQTPATGIKLALSMLRDGVAGKLNKEQSDLVHDAIEGNNRGISIVSDLLNVARVDSGRMILEKTSTDLYDLVHDIVREQQQTIEARKQSIRVTAEHVVALFDAPRLRMAIENLVSNASKYTPDGGKITIELPKATDTITIKVLDAGVGIAKKDIPRMFTKFTRIDNELSTKREGTGLGLYLAKQIVELHGGEILVESEVGKGSQFTVQLPNERHA